MNPTDQALIRQNALFKGMDFESFDYMLEHSIVRSLETGERLLQPEAQNHHLHLILDGSLNVYLIAQESQEHTSLRAGECVGEVSLIDGKYPSAIVVAAEPCRILSIPYDTVWSLINNSRTVTSNLLSILASRLRNDNKTIVDTQRSKSHFEHQASTDALTGVYNRHWMGKAFPRALQRCSHNKQPFAVMVVDIDHFKKINDTYGHLVGDLALKTVAKCMAENLRPHDLLARYGGEEFAVLLTEADLDAAKMVAERLRAKIAAAEIRSDDISFHVTLSIGITPTQHNEKLEHLIHEADQALYRAKQAGRNRVEVFH
ncbi:diguanylate cyclase [Ferrigenium kumadai]|uniref:diguanylate cyclase n=1 Tax=Ferrigenium kumadai TaxID=1682490 RepID=A0AAN1SYZ0_9PROT|nr:GGDEF domain-containing protein [Ferrigenium kumadai]BBI98369.1 diguanylate cyclase [Ferrigenium kumadai]